MLWYLLGFCALVYTLWRLLDGYLRGDERFWKKLGVPYVPVKEAPAAWLWMLKGGAFHEMDLFHAGKFPEARFMGRFMFGRPMLQINDPELVKRVMVKDFDHFVNRTSIDFGGELSDSFLLNMQDTAWKHTRSAMTPTFTSGKIKRMFEHFEKSSNELADYVERKNQDKDSTTEGLQVQEMFGRFSMDIIGSTAFGFDSQCLTQESSIFYRMGLLFNEVTLFRGLKFLVLILFPALANRAGICFFSKTAMDFFCGIVNRVLASRRDNYEQSAKKGSKDAAPSDFIQLMVETQKRWSDEDASAGGPEENEEEDEFERNAKLQGVKLEKSARVLTDKVVIANSFGFFIAGFDNTQASLTIATYHLAISPEFQTRIRDEVEKVTSGHRGRITYDSVAQMTYLDMFVNECLRLYPPTIGMERLVTKPYRIPDSDVVLPTGTSVSIPIMPFHHNPKYFPNPSQFDPENFSADNKATRHPYAYMTFGHGPRSCIGMRFVVTEIKAALAHLVLKFEIAPCAGTKIPLKVRENQGMMRPEPGLRLAFTKRTRS